MSDLARRYATAALDAAASPEASTALAQELSALAPHISSGTMLHEALVSPRFKSSRQALVEHVLARLKLSSSAIGLIHVLVKNGRLSLLPQISAAIQTLADERAGRGRAQVTSAIAIEGKRLAALEATLAKRFGHEVAVHVAVDPSLQAGMIVQVGSLTFDSSLKGQLGRLAQAMDHS